MSLGILPPNSHSLRGWPEEKPELKLEDYSLTFHEDGSREYKGTIRNVSEKNLTDVNAIVLFRRRLQGDKSHGTPGSELVSIEDMEPSDVRDFSILLQFERNNVYKQVDLLFFQVTEDLANLIPTLRRTNTLRPGLRHWSPRLIEGVSPVYPRGVSHQGVVILEFIVDPQGKVTGERIRRSIPSLDQAALDALKQWVYEPLRLNARSHAVVTIVPFTFGMD